PDSGAAYAQVVFLLKLIGGVQRMRAARVRPIKGKGNLLVGALLQKKLAVGVEEEDGEGAVEHPARYILVEVAVLFRARPQHAVVLVDKNELLLHQARLNGIVLLRRGGMVRFK